MIWYLYIVQCKDNSFYTGISTDVIRRINEHNKGIGAKSLRGKKPVKLIYKEIYNNQTEASKRESEIKGWSRKKKFDLINKTKGFTLKDLS